MEKIETTYIYIVAAFFVLLFTSGCKEEFDGKPLKYEYTWIFQNSCGGSVRVTVPNSVNTYSGKLHNNEWRVFTSTQFFNDSCQGVPIAISSAIKSFKVEVRDINHTLYFMSTDMHATWDGENQTGNGTAAPGAYFWKFRIEDLDGIIHEEHGVVNVMM